VTRKKCPGTEGTVRGAGSDAEVAGNTPKFTPPTDESKGRRRPLPSPPSQEDQDWFDDAFERHCEWEREFVERLRREPVRQLREMEKKLILERQGKRWRA
jgi:hypothetical protein